MSNEKILERIRKLLELSHSDNEHEAAQAAARAAQMMNENAVTEAMLQVVNDDEVPDVAERIIEAQPTYDAERRVAWRDRIAVAVAASMGCEVYYLAKGLHAIGRESAVQSWTYTCQYLFAEVERLADKAWLEDGEDLAAVGQRPRKWKSAFRLGAADVVHERLYRDVYTRQAKQREQAKELAAAQPKSLVGAGAAKAEEQLALARVDKVIAIVEKDRAEVKEAFKARTKGFRSTRTMGNSTRHRSGYSAGREAGASISLGGGKQLKS